MKSEGAAKPARLLSASQAARYLGIHRSSLHLAIKQNLIVPDHFTAGGHARFSHESLDAFVPHLAQPATNAQQALFDRLSSVIADPEDTLRGFRESLIELHALLPEFMLSFVVERTSSAQRYPTTEMIACYSDPPQVVTDFLAAHPGHSLVSMRVLRGGEPVYYGDIQREIRAERAPAGVRPKPTPGAYASLPLIAEKEPVGTLSLYAPRPTQFTPSVTTILMEKAREIALLLAYRQQRIRQQQWTVATGEYVRAITSAVGARDAEHGKPPLERLAQTFLSTYQAVELILEGGVPERPPQSREGEALVSRLDEQHAQVSDSWETEMGTFCGCAVAFSIPAATLLRVGALWHGEPADTEYRRAALLVLAGLYALGSATHPGDG